MLYWKDALSEVLLDIHKLMQCGGQNNLSWHVSKTCLYTDIILNQIIIVNRYILPHKSQASMSIPCGNLPIVVLWWGLQDVNGYCVARVVRKAKHFWAHQGVLNEWKLERGTERSKDFYWGNTWPTKHHFIPGQVFWIKLPIPIQHSWKHDILMDIGQLPVPRHVSRADRWDQQGRLPCPTPSEYHTPLYASLYCPG